MAKFHLPKAKPTEKDFEKNPWTENFRCENPIEKIKQKAAENGVLSDKLVNFLNFDCGMDRQKAELAFEMIENEVKIVANDQEVNLLINVPFCFSRCVGCTNVMYEKQKEVDIYPYFCDALKKEIECVKYIVKNKFYLVKNIVFTGNLMALEEDKIENIFRSINYSFSNILVEMGAPKFVTMAKLAVLKKYNVNLIVINQLSFNTLTLRKLCRKFEFKDLYESYKMIVGFGFDVAFEMVVGMPEEKELQLKRNIEIATDLGAVNIDLFAGHCKHTTDVETTNKESIKETRKLLAFAENEMLSKGYNPYFSYCTELEHGCFENVGFTVQGKANKFFVDKANKKSTILACGPNAESLLVQNIGNKKNTLKNTHSLSQYVFGIDEILEKKLEFFGLTTLQN